MALSNQSTDFCHWSAAVGREERCDVRYPDCDVLVFEHSHIPWDTTTAGGLRLLKPASPTDRRRQPYRTYITAVADAGSLRDATLVDVLQEPRSR